MTGLTLDITDDMLEQIARRAAELVVESQGPITGEDAWLRGAERIGAYIDAPASRVYALASSDRIPVERDGSALIAQRSKLDTWVRDGGGRRP
jgi:hypothetical protein